MTAETQGAARRLSSARTYPNVLRALFETPWALLPHTLSLINQVAAETVALRAQGIKLSDQEITERIAAGQQSQRTKRNVGAIAVIPVYGVIMPRASVFSDISGGVSLEQLQSVITEAANDPQVGSILLDIESPGGSAALVPETANVIRQARTKKPVVAVANTYAASAAYWLAAQADEIVVTPSGSVGSVGVYAAHEDWSKHDEQLGVKTTFVSAGPYKVEGNEFEPLSEEARQAIQAVVDEFYGMFKADVAKGRGTNVATVEENFGGGRMVLARQAVAAGMADRVDTFEGALARLAAGKVMSRGARAEIAEGAIVADLPAPEEITAEEAEKDHEPAGPVYVEGADRLLRNPAVRDGHALATP